MKNVRAYIARKQGNFSAHPFFARLRTEERHNLVARFAPRLAFWVMVFQDILRLNEQRILDTRLREIARSHRTEDAGHDSWFLSDLDTLGVEPPDLAELFGPAHTATRDAAYALVAEVFRVGSDHERIALLLCLESTGHVFFEVSANYLERVPTSRSIKYFSRHHIAVEADHELFEHRMTLLLDAVELSPDELRKATDLVDRTYAAFVAMFDALLMVFDRLSHPPQKVSGAHLP